MPGYTRSTALIVVDVQNDFADPGGSLSVKGGAEIVPGINREIEAARAAGARVAYTQDWHPQHTPHFAQDGGIWPVHCVWDTWGAAFHPALERIEEIVRKGADGKDYERYLPDVWHGAYPGHFFFWGIHWSRPDPMHFQYVTDY